MEANMPEEKKGPEADPGSPHEAPTLSEIAVWYRGLATRWPDVFPRETLSQYWNLAKAVLETEHQPIGTGAGRGRFHAILKAGMLRLLRAAVNDCTACELHTHRLKGRAVLDDGETAADPFRQAKLPVITGPVNARLWLLGSHPGALEGRTALPFTSATVLAGSACGSLCAEYAGCFPAKSLHPEAPCVPKWQGKPGQELPMARERAEDPLAWGEPGAGILDTILVELDEWRSSWNPRQRRRAPKPGAEPREGTVYLTDLVKCPTAGPAPDDPPRPVRSAEIRACHRWLEIQVYILQPQVIVAVGTQAQEAIVTLKESAAQSVAAVHPRWIARQPRELRPAGIQKLKQSLREARALALAPPAPSPADAAAVAPPAMDPLAPRHAEAGTTFPDAATEAAVKGPDRADHPLDTSPTDPVQ